MWAFEHFAGVTSIAITLDYFLFDGYCTKVSSELLSQAYIQILSELGKSLQGVLISRLKQKSLGHCPKFFVRPNADRLRSLLPSPPEQTECAEPGGEKWECAEALRLRNGA
jgi:hypothetical protein